MNFMDALHLATSYSRSALALGAKRKGVAKFTLRWKMGDECY